MTSGTDLRNRRVEVIAERLLGARIEHAKRREDGLLVIVFGHHGCGDDAGYMIVPPSFVTFNDGGDPDAWKNDDTHMEGCVLPGNHDGPCADEPPCSDPRPDPRTRPEWTE